VIAVALRVMREEGLEKVTMRRVAAELDTGPASLYVYVENMAELHGALLDELLAGLSSPAGAGGRDDLVGAGGRDDLVGAGWRDDLVALLSAYTGLLWQYPSLARSVLLLRPAGPRYMRLIDTLLGLLHDGGVPLRQAAWGVDLLLQLATSSAAEHGGADRGGEPDEDRHQRAAVREAGPTDFPHVDRARDELFSGTGGDRQRWAFAALIDGIARTPA
jgi:AcrR family transcriptional regulator